MVGWLGMTSEGVLAEDFLRSIKVTCSGICGVSEICRPTELSPRRQSLGPNEWKVRVTSLCTLPKLEVSL